MRVIIGARFAPPMRFQIKPKAFLDPARRERQFEVFAWLLRSCGGYAKFRETALVLSTEEFFPDRGMKGHAGVTALFRRVREHAGMGDWPCSVEPQGEAARISSDASGRIPVFTYPRGALEPFTLVADFARELARYLVATFEQPAPGGAQCQETGVELAAVFMGFGLFMVNAAARGVRYQSNEGELAHALALFCLLRKLPPDSADAYLNPHLRKYVRLAALDLAQHAGAFQKLRAVFADAKAAIPAISPH